jgi:SRSO17 transposase
VLSNFDQHFSQYVKYFSSKTRSVSDSARDYLCGLFQSSKSNIEKMSEVVANSAYHRMHHMLSDAQWDCRAVSGGLAQDANAHRLGSGQSGLLIDGSGFAKKGDKSAGVQRQWNGRHGKVDNCQVGVFGAIARGDIAALVDARLYLPQSWVDDPARCEEAGIPEEEQVHRSKGELAADIVRTARKNGLRFGFVGFDGEFGQLPWLLRDLADAGETFMADVHCDQIIYAQDPCPHVPARKSARGRAPRCLTSQVQGETVEAWRHRQPDSAWRRVLLRPGEKGRVMAEFLCARVYVWDGQEAQARRWHLLIRREIDGTKVKYCLCNAAADTGLHELARMQGLRFFVEQAFKEAKSACGMAEYQCRKWDGWHRHMAMVMIATMFIAKERLALRDTAQLRSCEDVVQMIRHRLPSKVIDDEDVVSQITSRHQRRIAAMHSAYQRQERELASTDGKVNLPK